MKLGLIKYLVLVFIVTSCENENKEADFKIKPLISSSKLMLLQQKGLKVVLIDVRPSDEYSNKHISNARNIWRPRMEDTTNYEYGGMMATKNQMEQLFSTLGIKYGDYLILYDAKGQVDAARLWWILHYYGYKKMSLLDGGIYDWERNSGAVRISKKEKITKSKFKFEEKENHDLYAKKEMINSKNVLVDCRSVSEFNGSQQKNGSYREGHIANAIHADYQECINMEIGSANFSKLKSKKKLLGIYTEKGITKNDSIVIYCHSGVRSAHSTFVLTQILGFKNVKNYDGSWIEWSYFDKLPTEKEKGT